MDLVVGAEPGGVGALSRLEREDEPDASAPAELSEFFFVEGKFNYSFHTVCT